MKALILTGGKSGFDYKPLTCILGRPIFEILLSQLKDFDIFVNVNKSDSYKLKQYSENVTFMIEDKREGNAKPIKELLDKSNEDVLVVHCDCYTDLDFHKFIDKSANSKELMTMSVRNISKGKSFGVAIFDTNKTVYGFTRDRYVNMGVYLARPGIKEYIKKEIYQDIDKDLIQKLIKDKSLGVYIHNGFWFDVGTTRVHDKFDKEKKHGKLHK